MKGYIGTKRLKAKPMTLGEYNTFRGWKLPEDEVSTREGMLVEYQDGGEANTTEYKGYVSWSPLEVFNASYRENGNYSFGDAIIALKAGDKVCRLGWNGKGMFLFLVQGSKFQVNRAPLLGIYPEGTEINQAHIDMVTAEGTVVPWLASQSDMLAEDWLVLD